MAGKSCLRRTTRAVAVGLVLLAAAGPPASSAIAESTRPAPRRLDALFEPTPPAVVQSMLTLAKVGRDDFLIDLGSGDGRIPITAARAYGARALGVDLDPRRVGQARQNARRSGVVGRVSFVQGDLFRADIRKATVITVFLTPETNRKLRPRLLGLRPGTRIVSHEHDMGAWQPDGMRISPAGGRALGDRRRVLLWVVPARVDGSWRLRVGGREIDVSLKQSYQRFSGSAMVDGRPHAIRNGRLSGDRIIFDLPSGGGRLRRLSGRVTPAGDIRGRGWEARRRV